MNKINTVCTQTETAFNKINSIPVVAIPGSIVRMALGQLQFEMGLITGVVGLAGRVIRPTDPTWNNLSSQGFDHIVHGILNQTRGFGEFLLSLTVVGPLVPLIYQSCAEKNGFAPVVNYETPMLGSRKSTVEN